MNLNDVETQVRQDLFDPNATRWANSDIDRAIDKAVDRYSQYYPNIACTDMGTQPYQRIYPYPTSWNANYPVLWLEKILYPLQFYGSQYPAPTTAPTATHAAGSGLSLGTYQYLCTFITQEGETLAAGPILIEGYAITGEGGYIERVELSVDEGATWTQATLLEQSSPWTWRFWEATLNLHPCTYQIVVRAWDSAGRAQPKDPRQIWNCKGYLNNAWHRVKIAIQEPTRS